MVTAFNAVSITFEGHTHLSFCPLTNGSKQIEHLWNERAGQQLPAHEVFGIILEQHTRLASVII